MSPLRILIVAEDQRSFEHVRAHSRIPARGPGAVHWLSHYEAARDAVFREAYDVAVLDSQHYGLQLLRDMARGGSDMPVVVLVDEAPPTRDAAGVTCEFVARDEIGSRRLERAIHEVVRRSLAVRAATRSQHWWRSGGAISSHATTPPVAPATGFWGDAARPALVPAPVRSAGPEEHPAQAPMLSVTPPPAAVVNETTQPDALLATILGNFPMIAGQIDDDGTILDCGGAGLEILGLSREALLGKNIFAYPSIPARALREALAGSSATFVRSWICDGKPRHFECHFRFDSARKRGAVGYARDITERIDAERARKKQELRFADMLRNLRGMVGRVDGSGRIAELEAAGLDEYEFEPAQLNGAWFGTAFPEGRIALELAIAGGSSRFETRINAGSENAWDVEFTLHFDRDSGTGAIFVGRDVTARRDLERQLVHAVDAERHRLGADLHDQVGQLLTGITCLSTALAERLRGRDDLAAEDATTIASVTKDALAGIRALARGLAPVRLAHEGLSFVLEDLCQQVRRMHDVEVRLQLVAEVVAIETDTAGHLFRIVQEAVANAIRHGGATTIDVSLRREDARYRLVIADNGQGFDPDIPRETPGSGLGLMEYRAAIIGGSLNVSSDRKKGTRIEILFSPTNTYSHENAC